MGAAAELVERVRRGERRAIARAMSVVERADAEGEALRQALRGATGDRPWWGFTGPPGVGKSTLIDAIIQSLRGRGRTVGVVAVDPSSQVGRGAVLGDRVRMMRHATDAGVFIRSLATHGCEGGLSEAAVHCARALELAGFETVLIETVGVGQNETELAGVADVRVVVFGPGYGDDVQLIKAGLLEIADVVVVNKYDLPEAARLEAEIRDELDLSSGAGRLPMNAEEVRRGPMRAEVMGVEARSGAGVAELVERLMALDEAAREPARRRELRRRRLASEVRREAMRAYERGLELALRDGAGEALLTEVESGRMALAEAVKALTGRGE